MKKEKTIKTHTRRTKSGKTVTVRQHRAKYDAAEEAKQLAKKIGAGKEFEGKKGKLKDIEALTPDEYKAWYHWDAAGDPKNKTALAVEKKLRAKMGRSEYNKYFDEVTNSYSSRGHLKAYKALEPETAKAIKSNKMVAGTAEAQKEVAKLQGAKKAEKIFATKEKEAKGNLNKLSGKGTESKYGRSTDSLTKRKAAEKYKLSYDENEDYVDKDGQTYRISENGDVAKRRYKYTTPNPYFHPDNVSKQVKFKAKEGNNYKMSDGSILTYIGGKKGEHRFKDFQTGKIKFKDSTTIYALSEQKKGF